jgi:chromosome segregation ATPase
MHNNRSNRAYISLALMLATIATTNASLRKADDQQQQGAEVPARVDPISLIRVQAQQVQTREQMQNLQQQMQAMQEQLAQQQHIPTTTTVIQQPSLQQEELISQLLATIQQVTEVQTGRIANQEQMNNETRHSMEQLGKHTAVTVGTLSKQVFPLQRQIQELYRLYNQTQARQNSMQQQMQGLQQRLASQEEELARTRGELVAAQRACSIS